MIQIDNKFVNDIKYNGNSIGRIMLDGDVYWGNDIVPTPPTPPLPSQYTQVEYITSNATSVTNMSWINTGFRPTNDTIIQFKSILPANRTSFFYYYWVTLFSALTWTNNLTHTGGDASFAYIIRTNNSQWPWMILGSRGGNNLNNIYNYTSEPFVYNDGIEHSLEGTFSTSEFIIDIDGIENTYLPETGPWAGLDGTVNSVSEICLCCQTWVDYSGNYTPKGHITQNIYYFKIIDNGVLVRDFVPVYDTITQKYGLYDLVGSQFYGTENPNVDFTGPQI